MKISQALENATRTIYAQQLEIARLELQIAQLTGDLRHEHTCCRCPRPGVWQGADELWLCVVHANGEMTEDD